MKTPYSITTKALFVFHILGEFTPKRGGGGDIPRWNYLTFGILASLCIF